jgi:hypothetical protein
LQVIVAERKPHEPEANEGWAYLSGFGRSWKGFETPAHEENDNAATGEAPATDLVHRTL